MRQTIAMEYVIRILLLIFVSSLMACFRASFANEAELVSLYIVSILLALFISDLICHFLYRQSIHKYHRFSYKCLNKRICNVWRLIRKAPVVVYLFVGILWKILVGIVSPDLSSDGANNSIAEGVSISFFVIIALILAPVLETLLFQVLPIEISNRITKKCTGKPCTLFSIVVSSLLFSIEHRFSTTYMCYAFVLGLYLAFFYLYTSRIFGKNWRKGFAATVLLHLFFNSLAFVAMAILNSQGGQ